MYLLWRYVYTSPLSIYFQVGRKLLLLFLGISSKRLFYRALIHVLVRVSRETEQTGYVGRGVYLYAYVCLFLFFYWGAVALQCCIDFCYTTKLISHMYTHIRTSLVAQMIKCLPATQDTWVRSLSGEDPPEKEKAILCSTLAWKIPWMEEYGRLQSMGFQRVGHYWVTSLLHTYIHSILDLPPTLLSHPSRSSQSTELSSLFYTVCSH